MESGFLNYKDIFEVLIIPVTLTILAVLFPAIQSWHLRRRFKKLILRELREISPYPPDKNDNLGIWSSHQTKQCIHQKIFANPSENRDFILSLSPNLVYYLSNLWDPENKKDKKAVQWKHYLSELKFYFNDMKLNKVYENWENLIEQYQN